MNKLTGIALALAALFAGGIVWGWQGVVLATTVIVFWLLLQFSRLMRVMKAATSSPVGHVDSAVMLNAKLRAGLKLVDVIPLTRSLGVKQSADPDCYAWTDPGGARVEVLLEGGLVTRWTLIRPDEQTP